MPHHLLLGFGMLALGQASELLGHYRTLKSPLLRELSSPLAMALLLPAPVVRFLGRELAGMIRPGLATGERFRDRQHRSSSECRASGLFEPVTLHLLYFELGHGDDRLLLRSNWR